VLLCHLQPQIAVVPFFWALLTWLLSGDPSTPFLMLLPVVLLLAPSLSVTYFPFRLLVRFPPLVCSDGPTGGLSAFRHLLRVPSSGKLDFYLQSLGTCEKGGRSN
jgi:hypothetical protein